MPRIPGVPGLDPVSHPTASPGEFGAAGEAISKMGDSLQDDTLQQQGLNLFMKRAQEHVDTLAARNQLDAAYADIQNQLSKTPNSRDVPGVIEQGNKTLNDISTRWSSSPAAISIQQEADSLRPSMSRVGTVRQIDLMGKELKITLAQQAEKLAGEYAGGNRTGAEAAFGQAVGGGVKTGLLGDAEAGEYMRQFRQTGQELQIRNGITNSNPEVNQKTYDDISQHRDQFPDLTQEQLDTYKGQALSAFESHTKFQAWSEGQMAENTMLRPLITQHTNPATGQFNEAQALDDVAKRFADGSLTPTQRDVLSEGVRAQTADLKVGVDKEAGKRKDDIVKLFDGRNADSFKQGYAQLEATRPWFEENGHSDLYEGLHKYGEQMQREQRAEGREEMFMSRQFETEQSGATLGGILSAMSQGYMFTDSQIYGMAGQGKGKMKSSDVMEAIRATKAYQADPTTQAAVNLLTSQFPLIQLKTTSTAEEIAAASEPNAKQSKRQALTYQAWQAEVNAHPQEDKVAAMRNVMEPAIQQHIAEQINQVFGVEPEPKTLGSVIRNFLSPSSDLPRTDADKPLPLKDRSPAGPKDGDKKKNSSGDPVVYSGGQWRPDAGSN